MDALFDACMETVSVCRVFFTMVTAGSITKTNSIDMARGLVGRSDD